MISGRTPKSQLYLYARSREFYRNIPLGETHIHIHECVPSTPIPGIFGAGIIRADLPCIDYGRKPNFIGGAEVSRGAEVVDLPPMVNR